MSAPDLAVALRRAQLLTDLARRVAELDCTCGDVPRHATRLCPSCDARSTLAQLPPPAAPTYTRGPGSRRRP